MIRHYANIELRALESESENKVEGLACVFDKETDLGYFYEKIDKRAFDNCDMSDCYLLFNHDENYVLARTLNGSLELEVSDKGLYQRSTIVPTATGNDIYKLVKDGLINKMSFAFSINRENGEKWETDEEGREHRTILKVDRLYDVSLVTHPAYESTSAFARSLSELDELAKEHMERKETPMEENKEALVNETAPVEETPVEEEKVNEAPVVEEEAPMVEEPKEMPMEEKAEEPVAEEKPVEEEKKEVRSMNTNFDNVSVENVAYNSTKEYRHAWVKAITGRGDAELNAIKEARGLSTASATLVPTYIADKIATAWEKNVILNEVSITYSTAKLSFPVETANSGAVWHAENGEAVEEEQITLVDKLLQPMNAKKFISITDELISGTDESIMDYIAEEVTYFILKLISNSIVAGTLTAGKGIEGIVNSSLADPVNAGALDGTTFYKGLAPLVDVDAPVVLMNPTDFYGKVMGLLDTTGRPIYSVLGAERFVAGCRVILSNAVPTNKAIVGDLSAYRLEMEAREPKIIFDPYTSAREDKVNVVGKLMTAGALVKPHKLAVVTFTA